MIETIVGANIFGIDISKQKTIKVFGQFCRKIFINLFVSTNLRIVSYITKSLISHELKHGTYYQYHTFYSPRMGRNFRLWSIFIKVLGKSIRCYSIPLIRQLPRAESILNKQVVEMTESRRLDSNSSLYKQHVMDGLSEWLYGWIMKKTMPSMIRSGF